MFDKFQTICFDQHSDNILEYIFWPKLLEKIPNRILKFFKNLNLQILHLISELIFYQLLQKKSHHLFSGLLLAEFLVAYGQSLISTRNSKNQYLHDALMDLNSNCFALSMLMTWHFTCVMSETLLSLVPSSLPYIVLLEKVPLSREKVEDLLIIILTLTMLT